jgi:hypothetical protein
MRRISLWMVLLLFILTGAVQGFESVEHRTVSNDALKLAYGHFLALGYPIDPNIEAIITSLESGGSYLDYGEMVRLVDHVVDPLKTLERRGRLDLFPCTINQLDRDLIARILPEALAEYRVLTVNDTHFGAELLLNLRFWHRAASEMAASGSNPNRPEPCGSGSRDGNLLTALMLNSVSDHFLEDFFAPGHIYTPRFGLHDAVAGAMHDQYNILGTKFRITPGQWGNLRGILDSMTPSMLERIGVSKSQIEEVRQQGLYQLELWGDGDLARSPLQRLFMTLVVARSVLDILESYAQGCVVNNFSEGLTWKPLQKVGLNPLVGWSHAEGGIPFGTHSVPSMYQGPIQYPMVLWFSGGSEMLTSSGEVSSRALIEIDSLAAWSSRFRSGAGGQLRPTSWQVGLITGYSYAWNEDETADGPRAGLMLAYPLIHSQFLVEATYLHYETDRLHDRALGYGVGFQTGFSLLTLDLRAGRGYRFDESGVLQDTWTIRTGLAVAVPLLRIPLLGRIEHALWVRQRKKAMALP